MLLGLLFLLLVGAVVVVGVLALLGAAGRARRSRAGDHDRSGVDGLGGSGPPLALVAGVGLVVLVVAGPLVLGLARGSRGGDGDDPAGLGDAPRRAATAPPGPSPAREGVRASDEARAMLGPLVRVDADETGAGVGELRSGLVLRVRVGGFPAYSRAMASQCQGDACGNPIRVQFDGEGHAAFQYLITDRFLSEVDVVACGAEDPPCTIVVAGLDAAVSAEVRTVFHDAFPRPRPSARPPAEPAEARPVPAADYDGRRLAAGLVVAALLLAVAWSLLRRTDWGPVGEEAAPEIDDAEYADLDAIVAALPPEPDLDEMVAALRD